MKKILALVLATTLGLSMIACGNNEVVETTESVVETTETVTTESTTTENVTTDGPTVGEIALEAFETYVAANEGTAEDAANAVAVALEDIFGPVVMPVEEGLLTGFDNVEIKGFKEGAMFAPMIGTIPFVGYVFTMDDAAAATELCTLLEESANPRWNICTEADEMFTTVSGNKVFFVMSPSSFE